MGWLDGLFNGNSSDEQGSGPGGGWLGPLVGAAPCPSFRTPLKKIVTLLPVCSRLNCNTPWPFMNFLSANSPVKFVDSARQTTAELPITAATIARNRGERFIMFPLIPDYGAFGDANCTSHLNRAKDSSGVI